MVSISMTDEKNLLNRFRFFAFPHRKKFTFHVLREKEKITILLFTIKAIRAFCGAGKKG